MNARLIVRKMKESDNDFIVGLSSRCNEFEFMGWRDSKKMQDAQLQQAQNAINNTDPQSDIFVVEDENNNLLGFLHMTKSTDFFTGEEQGYLSSIAVSKEGEGKGIAKLLMEKAEEWTKNNGYKQLVLNVFANNKRAINFYSHLNFENEIIKMVKEL
jgi:ribosomal protein S18 acetylase RimI-like enzyme